MATIFYIYIKEGRGLSSVIEHLLITCKTLDSISSTTRGKNSGGVDSLAQAKTEVKGNKIKKGRKELPRQTVMPSAILESRRLKCSKSMLLKS